MIRIMPLARPRAARRRRRRHTPVWPLVLAGLSLSTVIVVIGPAASSWAARAEDAAADSGFPHWVLVLVGTVVLLAGGVWLLGNPRRSAGPLPAMTMVEATPSFPEDARHLFP